MNKTIDGCGLVLGATTRDDAHFQLFFYTYRAVQWPLQKALARMRFWKSLGRIVAFTVSLGCAMISAADLPDIPSLSQLMQSNITLNIVVLTIGSRGDVQYLIPLCARFVQRGHRCTLATHERFRSWIESGGWGIDFAPIAGDPNAIMVRLLW
jgi:hypothetical protein